MGSSVPRNLYLVPAIACFNLHLHRFQEDFLSVRIVHFKPMLASLVCTAYPVMFDSGLLLCTH